MNNGQGVHGTRSAVTVLVLAVTLALVGRIWAQDDERKPDAEVLAAVASVDLPRFRQQWPVICVSEEGYFFGSGPALSNLQEGDTLVMTLRPGTKNSEVVRAVVVRRDHRRRFILLRAPVKKSPFLEFGDPATLKEGHSVTALGLKKMGENGEGAVSVAAMERKVRKLYQVEGVLRTFDFKAVPEIALHGGPVLDRGGKLIGISGGRGAWHVVGAGNWARLFCARPVVEISEMPHIELKARHDAVTLRATLRYLVPPSKEPSLAAWMVGSRTGEREITVRKTGARTYDLTGIPVAPGTSSLIEVVRVDAARRPDPGRSVSGSVFYVLDGEISVGDTKALLSKFSLVRPGHDLARLRDGPEVKGAIDGLTSLRLARSERTSSPPLGEYDTVVIRPEQAMHERLVCRIAVIGEYGQFLEEFALPLWDPGLPVVAQGEPELKTFAYPQVVNERFAGERETIKLSGICSDVAWGAGGRYLVARIEGLNVLEIVDCLTGRMIGTIPMKAPEDVFAGAGNEILVGRGGLVERWSYDPLKRVAAPKEWVPGRIVSLATGSGATQFAAVRYDVFGGIGFNLLDLRELGTGRLIVANRPRTREGSHYHLRASFDGYTYGLGQTGLSERQIMFPRDRTLALETGRRTGPWHLPGVEGGLIFGGDGTVWARGKRLSVVGQWSESSLIPTTVKGLACKLPPVQEGKFEGSPVGLGIVDVSSGRELLPHAASLDELDSSKDKIARRANRREPLTLDKRCLCSPQLSLLSTLGWDNQSVVVRNLDLWQILRANGEKFLYVTGGAPVLVSTGAEVVVDLRIESSATERRFQLEVAPPGMTVGGKGVLRWVIPEDHSPGMEPVVLRIHSGDGQEKIWTHEFAVR